MLNDCRSQRHGRHNVDINADSHSLSFVPPRTTDLQRRGLAVTVMTYSPRLKHWCLPSYCEI
jgi:hypothetical protein